MTNPKTKIFHVSGMHCPSCELLIENKLLKVRRIKSADVSADRQELKLDFEGEAPTPQTLNRLFKDTDYRFFNHVSKTKDTDMSVKTNRTSQDYGLILGISVVLIIGFLVFNRLGLSGWLDINLQSAIPTFFVFGLLAGFSSCSALVGGIILSSSKQWSDLYLHDHHRYQKYIPQILFNTGRLLSYGLFGGLLGLIGSRLQLSLGAGVVLAMAVSLLMLVLGVQMLGKKINFRLTLPKSFYRYTVDSKNFKGRYMPFLMGAATFILPCGFTLTAQSMALASGDLIRGAMIMFVFALGTSLPLFMIGLSSLKFIRHKHLAERFTKIAGIMVIFFAFYNINSQLNVLGFTSLNDVWAKKQKTQNLPVPTQVQVIRMNAYAQGYEPNYFQIKAGVPVRWEITDQGTSGCTNAVISRGLFEGEILLKRGQVSIKEFMADKPGKYKFSCWMGMVTGTIEVVEAKE